MSLPMHIGIAPYQVQLGMSDLTNVAAALSKQVQRDFSPFWNVSATVDAFATLDDIPTDYWPIIVTHDPKGGGYHETDNGKPYAIVDLDDQWGLTASHECLEMLADPFGQRTVAGQLLDQAVALGMEPRRVLYLVEICDPSESGQFAYPVNGVTVSDFYTPHYFDPLAAPGVRYSYHGSINGPREVLDGGYISWQDSTNGQWWQLRMFRDEFSQDVPHILNLSALTDFESLKRKENIRAAIDRVTKAPQYRAGLTGKVLQRSMIAARSVQRARTGHADELRAAMAALNTHSITFADVQAYLDAIADKANADIGNSPHGRFWQVSYDEFVTGTVPNVSCLGHPVPLINQHAPLQSPFYLILTDSAGWCSTEQMPGGGPYITDAGYTVTLANGTTITGQQIQNDLANWLSNGFPK